MEVLETENKVENIELINNIQHNLLTSVVSFLRLLLN